MKPLPFTSSNASWKSGDGVSDQFPAHLRVLVVDDDPTCLRILEKMLKNCLDEGDNRNAYDIVISDVHIPGMDGFRLLEHVGLEMDLPVITDDSKSEVMKGVTHGACDYLIKPVRMEALKNIWRHVVRKKKHEWKEKDFEQWGSVDDERQQKLAEDVDYSSSANEGDWKNSKKRKDEEDEADERDDTSTLKKPRVVWSVELHQQFVTVVNQLGIDSRSQSNSLIMPMVQLQSRTQNLNDTNVGQSVLGRNGVGNVCGQQYTSVSQPSPVVDFSSQSREFQGNSFPVVRNSGMSKRQDEVNAEVKGSRSFVPNYNVFDGGVNQNRNQNWCLQNIGSTFEGPQQSYVRGGLDVSPSVLIQQRFPSNQESGQSRIPSVNKAAVSVGEGFGNTPNVGPQLNSSFSDNSFRIKG
ncbi:hypothetical protein DH2020_027472 [Rehmannia glutinosa]|uniref:Response regulatory domain-containing protein n=1 Tax=Rehmannia glutinosa TaxID=99300 RepID=A0ABR0VU39_REHGL